MACKYIEKSNEIYADEGSNTECESKNIKDENNGKRDHIYNFFF